MAGPRVPRLGASALLAACLCLTGLLLVAPGTNATALEAIFNRIRAHFSATPTEGLIDQPCEGVAS